MTIAEDDEGREKKGLHAPASSTHSTVRGTATPCSFHSRVMPHLTAIRPVRRFTRDRQGA